MPSLEDGDTRAEVTLVVHNLALTMIQVYERRYGPSIPAMRFAN